MRNTFLEKSFTKYEETIPTPVSKKKKLSMSLNQSSEVFFKEQKEVFN